jgi:hypothetical protein
MVTWYKHDIPAWMDATGEMSDDQYRVYHVICQLIYLNEGPIKRHDRGIAGRCNQDIRRTKRIISELVEAGYLVEMDGTLGQLRADVELSYVLRNRYVASMGGVRSGEARRKSSAKSLKKGKSVEAPLKTKTNREDKSREDNKTRSKLLGEFNDTFWPLYPNKVKKKDAFSAFQKARTSVDLKTIMDGLNRYIECKPPTQNWAHPTSWLNQERWEDQHAPPAKQTWRDENGTIYVKANGPEGEAWQRFYRSVNDERSLANFRYAGADGEVKVRSRWPRRV